MQNNLKDIVDNLEQEISDQLEAQLSSGTLDTLGNLVIKKIRERTLAGLDQHGKPFVNYSDSYSKTKIRNGKHSGNVDLHFSGEMINSLIFVPLSPLNGYVTASGTRNIELAEFHQQGLGNNPQRQFLGWQFDSDEDRSLISAARNIITS